MNNDDYKNIQFKDIEEGLVVNKGKSTPYILDNEELKRPSVDYKALVVELESLDKEKEFDKMLMLREKLNELKRKLWTGIPLELDKLKNEITRDIYLYLEKFGYSRDFVIGNLEDLELYVSDVDIIAEGKIVTVGNKIGIDSEFVDFDRKGNIIGIKDYYKLFLKYTLTHEFLHKLSSNRKDKPAVPVLEDALIEGSTDMYAHLISENDLDKSNLYDFLVKVCIILRRIVGNKEFLQDYIDNLPNWTNTRKVFSECGLNDDDFSNLYFGMNKVLAYTRSGMDPEGLNKLKEEIIVFIKNRLIRNRYTKKRELREMEKVFNILFNTELKEIVLNKTTSNLVK